MIYVGGFFFSAPAVTWDPAFKDAAVALSNGNLTATKSSAGATGGTRATTNQTAGKWYFEVLIGVVGPDGASVGLVNATWGVNSQIGDNANGWGLLASGSKYHSGTPAGPILAAPGAGAVIQVAYDATAGNLWWGVNNTFSGSPSAGTGAAYTGVTAPCWAAVSPGGTGGSVTGRFKTADFSYTPPTGFSPWGT